MGGLCRSHPVLFRNQFETPKRTHAVDMPVEPPPGTSEILRRVTEYVPMMQEHAAACDREGAFPIADMQVLRDIGVLAAPVPVGRGGLGLGTDAPDPAGISKLLRLLGRGNLSVARVVEAHVNALRLVFIYGNETQQERAAEAALAGHLFALWVTDGSQPLEVIGPPDHGRLRGAKEFCSAAGHATQAVVTADIGGSTYLLHIAVDPSYHPKGPRVMPQGMRSTATGRMDMSGLAVAASAIIGHAGDYLREPEFSAGAWRTCAALQGGLESLVSEMRAQLIARQRENHPHQLARVGQAMIAQETASMWVERATRIGDDTTASGNERHAYINLTRIAVEKACLDALQLAQRSLGLGAFVPPNPVERISRDLATYLRQPALDEALADAAGWFMRHDVPALAAECS
jgi:alkylation response protein AidB-like acyl-CoA dehydrogenase